ncbi:MAG: glycerol-3-phosphate dehydrogenase, partial [Rhodospirillaceae bacterium]
MREGSLDAPTRHVIDWTNPDYIDPDKLDAEMRRQFDICHGCRRCFNLCDSFPRLFDLIDEAEDAELEGVKSGDFKHVVDACTLCDMCFLTKCPYVPPHEFNIDFPHLMLRYRAADRAKNGTPFFDKQLTETDRNGKMAALAPGLANWASSRGNSMTRPAMEKIANVHRDAELPKYHGTTFMERAQNFPPRVNTNAPAAGRKAAVFATCFA